MDQRDDDRESLHDETGTDAPWEVVVVGAGAAGLLAALTAARGGARVLLLESTKDGGRKILISGGGRCNILPSQAAPERYVTESSPNTLRKILRSWPLPEQIAFFERELGQSLAREPETGKLFPETNRARDVRDRLVARAREAGTTIWFEARVDDIGPIAASGDSGPIAASGDGGPIAASGDGGPITRDGEGALWRVALSDGQAVTATTVILATGGLSVPATGSDGRGFRIASKLGITLNDRYPALTPLVLDPPAHKHLAGVSLPVTIRAPRARPRFESSGGFLITHRGYSGPTVLDASHLAVRARAKNQVAELLVQWTLDSAETWDARLMEGAGSVGGALERSMPKRLSTQLLHECGVEGATPRAQLSRDARRRLVATLCAYPLRSSGDEGYKKAEVTGGGVALSEVDPRTLQVRKHPGLFLCGEILDAFGPIGGHNFMWAWATGRAAAGGAVDFLAARDSGI